MIIYNKTWLENLDTRQQASKWFRQQLISAEEKTAIEEANPVGFYSPGFWMSLGLFFFTVILISAASGFVTAFVLGGIIAEEKIVSHIALFVFAGVCFFMAEYYKSSENYFHAGTDNALVWAGTSYLIGNVFWVLFEAENIDETVFKHGFLLSFIICAIVTLRYADILAAISAFACWFVFVFMFFGSLSELTKALLPFISLINAAGIYFLLKKYAKGNNEIYYRNCLPLIEAASLIVAYASVNYFVVREMSIELFDLEIGEGQDIPFAFVFYFFTVAAPFAYIYFGLKLKNRMMLRIGLLLIAATIFTIRHYHSVMPVEIAMTLGGAVLLGVSFGLIRFLKTPKYGLTFENDDDNSGIMKVEGLIIAQTFGTSTKAENGSQFGGGDFGGGGSSGNF